MEHRLLGETSHDALVAVERVRSSGEYSVCRLRVKSKGATGSIFCLVVRHGGFGEEVSFGCLTGYPEKSFGAEGGT